MNFYWAGAASFVFFMLIGVLGGSLLHLEGPRWYFFMGLMAALGLSSFALFMDAVVVRFGHEYRCCQAVFCATVISSALYRYARNTLFVCPLGAADAGPKCGFTYSQTTSPSAVTSNSRP